MRQTLKLGVLLASAAAAAAIRHVVATNVFDDRTNLLISGTTVVVLMLAAALTARLASTRRRWRLRGSLAVVPLGLLVICAGFVQASFIDASVEMESLVEAAGPVTPPASVVLGPGGRDVRLTGEFQEGVAARLSDLLAANPSVTRIHLTSEGGLADEGQAIGDVIAAHRLTTFVPDYCVSACTLAFVRGRERLVLDDTRLGFHAPYEPGLFGAMYRGDGDEQRAAYIAAGVAPDFVDAALKVAPGDMWYPTQKRLFAAHVITARVDRYRLPDSNLDGSATIDGARDLILRNFALLGVFTRTSPHAIDKIAAWYLDAYNRGRPEGENTDTLRTISRSAVALGLARADDSTLLDLARFLERALDGASPSAAGLCADVAGRIDLIAAAHQLEANDPSAVETATGLFERAMGGRNALPDPDRIVKPISLVGTDDALATELDVSCAGWRRQVAAVLRQDNAIAAMSIRALVNAEAYRSLVALKAVLKPRT